MPFATKLISFMKSVESHRTHGLQLKFARAKADAQDMKGLVQVYGGEGGVRLSKQTVHRLRPG